MATLSGAFSDYNFAHRRDCDYRRRSACAVLGGPPTGLANRHFVGALAFVRGPLAGSGAVLNWLRPRLSTARGVQVGVRLLVWFVGGFVLALGMRLTAILLTRFRPAHLPAWWIGGLAFIGIELVAHLVLQLRGRASFYNGRG